MGPHGDAQKITLLSITYPMGHTETHGGAMVITETHGVAKRVYKDPWGRTAPKHGSPKEIICKRMHFFLDITFALWYYVFIKNKKGITDMVEIRGKRGKTVGRFIGAWAVGEPGQRLISHIEFDGGTWNPVWDLCESTEGSVSVLKRGLQAFAPRQK